MRRTSHSHSLSLVRLLTFASVIGSQFHVLSVSATEPHFDDSNTTTISEVPTTSTSSSTPKTLSAALSTTTSGAELYSSKASRTISTTSISSFNSSGSVTSHGGSTAATLNSVKSTSKFPLEFSVMKNHWTNADTPAAAGAMLPPGSVASDVERPRTFRNKHHHEHHWGPFFEEPLNTTTTGDNLVSTAHLFTEAVLNCRVGMLKDKTVMWVRRTTEKVSLLTVGNVTYSGDPRIRVKFQYPNNWRLLINPTQREDAGVYMCQVSTHPPRVFTTNLTILEPPLRLIDDQEREVSDRYYKSGSTIDLQCQISKSFVLKEKQSIIKSMQSQLNQSKTYHKSSTVANAIGTGTNELFTNGSQTGKQGLFERQHNNFIFWTKDDRLLPAAAVKKSSSTEKWLNSRISIPDAKLTDSGNYSCSIGKLFRAIVLVQVLTGELPAAVQHNSAQSVNFYVHPLLVHLPWICFLAAFTHSLQNISLSIRTGSKSLQTLLLLCY